MREKADSQVIRGFNGLRAIAVSMVVLSHIGLTDLVVRDNRALFFLHGGSGVTIFFALSGFLITTLLMREYDATGTASLKNFYLRRALRIFPLYILVVFLTFAMSMSVYRMASGRTFLFAAIYMTNFVSTNWYAPILAHTWSLAVEEHFYLLWPLTLTLLQFRRTRAVALLCTTVIASVLLLNVLMSSRYLVENYFLYRWTPIAGSAIALGCLSALIASRLSSASRRLLGSRWTLVIAVLLFANSLICAVFVTAPRAEAWPTDTFSYLPGYLDAYFQAAGAALLVTWVYINQSSRVVAVLELPPLNYVGVISYGIYMWQGFFLSTGPSRAAGELWPPKPLIGFVCLWVVAPLSYHFFERPFLKLKSRFSSRTAV